MLEFIILYDFSTFYKVLERSSFNFSKIALELGKLSKQYFTSF
jgi:hypothetical protein